MSIFLIRSSSRKKIKLQLGKWVHTAFQTGRMQSCYNLMPKKKLIYNELIWHFIHSKITLGNTYEKVVFNKISGLQPANANKSEVTYK